MRKEKGAIDQPASLDGFEISNYIRGLSEFILECPTPMTISVQGDWGTGKTSIMELVRKELSTKKNLRLIWFNTWQFSQFSFDETLPLIVLKKLVDEVGGSEREIKNKCGAILSGVADIGFSLATGRNIESIRKIFEDDDFLSKFEKLRSSFQGIVNKSVGAGGKIIIFIDDLDRLAPGRAVEVLEVLKLFFDCEHCVFVLAIDYAVVIRGVKDKYGEDFNEEKGKSFFDKIIQVPFKVPVENYDIQNYVRNCFEQIGMPVEKERDLDYYIQLISHSIGNNPRSIKRLFNSYLLLNKITNQKREGNKDSQTLLFAMLCLQSKYPTFYSYIVSNRNCINKDMLLDLKRDDSELQGEINAGEAERKGFSVFSEDLVDLVLPNGTDTTEEKIETFKNMLNFSTTTASDMKETAIDGRKLEYWEEFVAYAFSEDGDKRLQSLKISPSKLANRNWYALRCGTTKGNIELSFNLRDKSIRTAFLIRTGEKDFQRIDKHRQEIIAELSSLEGTMKWDGESKTCSVGIICEKCDINNRKQRREQFDWFVECTYRLAKRILPILSEV